MTRVLDHYKKHLAITAYIALCAIFVVAFAIAETRYITYKCSPAPTGDVQGEGDYVIQCTWKLKTKNPGPDIGTASVTGTDSFERDSDETALASLSNENSVSLQPSKDPVWISAFDTKTVYLEETSYTHRWTQSWTVEQAGGSGSKHGAVDLQITAEP